MNVFNKLVVIILLLVLLALSLMLALFPAQTLQSISAAFARAAGWVQTLQANQPLLYALGRVGLAVVAILVVLPLLWQQIKRRRPRAVRVVTETGSQASVTTDSVAAAPGMAHRPVGRCCERRAVRVGRGQAGECAA